MIAAKQLKKEQKNTVYPATKQQTTLTIPGDILIDSSDITPPQVELSTEENDTNDMTVETVSTIKKTKEIGTDVSADISFEKTSKLQDMVIQSGYESLKEYQTRVITTPFSKTGKYIMPEVEDSKEELINPFPTETVNKFKEQYKSGS